MKNGSLKSSFAHAVDGIKGTVRGERNMKIHVSAAVLVTLAGFLLRISEMEWLVCILWFSMVISCELFNTALEAAVDLAAEEYKPLAKKAKDAAAGGVLIAAIGAAVSGAIIFLPKVIGFLRGS